jgi:hypothetical protein
MDEDSMDQALNRALRARAVDVQTALEAGMIERSDSDHLAYATEQGRVLCTYNIRDFWAIHLELLNHDRPHAGLILMPQQRFPLGELLRRLLSLSNILTQPEMVSRAEFISNWEPER